jgi:hypothetical protein
LSLFCNGLIIVFVGLGVAASGPTGSEPLSGARNQSHTLKLTSFAIPAGAPLGLLLKVRIDNGPVLRLLLDSGAEFIVLDKKAAPQSGHADGSEFDLVGMGRSPKAARMAKAGTVAVGDLIFQDCKLIIAPGKVVDGIDGVIPLSLFAGFLMRLDLPAKTLDLRPYPPARSVEDGHLSPVHAQNDLLFIKGVLNYSREGYVLLDTGASFNVISESTARALKYPPLFASSVQLQSGAGAREGSMYRAEVRFRFGSRVVAANPVMVVGLHQFEQYNQIEVAGILGYPALRESILTINYRDGLVGIDRK